MFNVCGIWGYICLCASAYLYTGRMCVFVWGVHICVCLWRAHACLCVQPGSGCPRASLMVAQSALPAHPLYSPWASWSLLGDLSRSLRPHAACGVEGPLRLTVGTMEHCSQTGSSCADMGGALGLVPTPLGISGSGHHPLALHQPDCL